MIPAVATSPTQCRDRRASALLSFVQPDGNSRRPRFAHAWCSGPTPDAVAALLCWIYALRDAYVRRPQPRDSSKPRVARTTGSDMSTESPKLLHITYARQDESWVQGVLLPA